MRAEQIGHHQNQMNLGSGPLTFTVALTPGSSPVQGPQDGKLDLRFEWFTGTGEPPAYDVYVNLPKGVNESRAHFAGTIGFYGLALSCERPNPGEPKGQTQVLDVTQLLARLNALPEWSDTQLKITLKPRRTPPADATLTMGPVGLWIWND